MKIRAIVFDLYNTLIEIKASNHFFLQLFKQSQNGFNLDLPAYLRLVMTKDIEELFAVLPSEFKALFDQRSEHLEKELASVIVYDEVFEVLEALGQEFSVFLISNLASPYKRPVFENGLDQYFEKMIFSCDEGFVKPEIEIFQEVEKHTKHRPNEILMVGDSFKSDVKGAQNMGWNYLKINRSSPSEAYEIKDLREIKKYNSS